MSENTVNNNKIINDLNFIKVNTKREEAKTDAQRSIFSAIDANNDGVISENEYKGMITGKIKGKNGIFKEKQCIKLKDIENRRSIVVDENGKKFIMAHDGTILKAAYVAVKTAQENLQKAQNSFKAQQKKDGWAGKTADAVSALWDSDNRASKVSKDLKQHSSMIAQLVKSVNTNSAAFAEKFKKTFGVEYNESAVTEYLANPNEESYEKAFGNKNNIQKRVEKYNESQELGSTVVKTGAKIVATGAAAAAVVASGGTAGVAMAAGLSLGSSAVVDTSDRLSAEQEITKEDIANIAKEAAIDGVTVGAVGKIAKVANVAIKGTTIGAKVARGSVKAAGNGVVGAATEYVQTGEVSASSVATNMAIGSVGIAAEEGAFNKVGKALKKVLKNSDNNVKQKSRTIVASNGKKYTIVSPSESRKIKNAKISTATQNSPKTQTSEPLIVVKNPAKLQMKKTQTAQAKSVQSQTPKPQAAKPQPSQVQVNKPQTAQAKSVQSQTPKPQAAKPQPSQVHTDNPKPVNTQNAKPEKPAVTKTTQPKTFDEISDEMDKIGAKLKALRENVSSKYQAKIDGLENERTRLQTLLQEKQTKYYAQSATQTKNIDTLSRTLTEAKTQLSNLQSKNSALEQKVISTRSALRDMEEQLVAFQKSEGKFGASIGELHKHANANPKRFIGAEFKDNVSQKAIPENAPSYYYDHEVADLFHAYNVASAQNKSSVVSSLRDKLTKLEAMFKNSQSSVQGQQELVKTSEQKLSSAYSARNTLDSEFDTFNQQCKNDMTSLKNQIADLSQSKNAAMQNLKESPDYQALSNEWKTLQQQLRNLD